MNKKINQTYNKRRGGVKVLVFTILTLSCAAIFAAESPVQNVRATINKKRISVGDRIRYKLDVGLKGPVEIKFPEFKGARIGDAEIKDSGKDWLDITSYSVGKRIIPPIELKYRRKGEASWHAGKTNELTFAVESVLPRGIKLYDIKDIKGPIYPFSFLKVAIWAGFILFGIWILIKLIKLFRRKAPPKLPHQIAFEALEAAQKNFASDGDIKEYFVNISDAIRRYVETVFSLRAPEMTTQEFLESLNNSTKLSSSYRELLKIFMESCDLVKFAKKTPSGEEVDSVFMTAKKFIEETRPATNPPSSASSTGETSARFQRGV